MDMGENISVIIQARLGSTRMPKKVLLPFYGQSTILDLIIDKIKRIQIPLVVATTTNPQDNLIEEVKRMCFLGLLSVQRQSRQRA